MTRIAEAVEHSVDDPGDPRLEVYMGLRDRLARQAREGPGGDMSASFMAEGDAVIARGLKAGHELVSVLVDARRSRPLPPGTEAVAVLRASPEVLVAVCGRPKFRDPIARFVRPHPEDPGALVRRSRTVAVLEGVVNPTNVGVIMRCAAGLGIDAVLVDPTSCDPLYRRAVRVSMGEVFSVAHARIEALPDSLGLLTDAGFITVALTPASDAVDIGTIDRTASDRIAIIVGAEGHGLSMPTLERAQVRARIPLAAGVDSINVASAAAIAFHALCSP